MREDYPNYRRFECMTLEFDAFGPIQYELRESADCLRRQLAQRDERNAALEARNGELEADFVAVAPVVLAAAMQVEARDAWTALIDSAASAAYYDACETTEGAARALPADVRERLMALGRMGVDRG